MNNKKNTLITHYLNHKIKNEKLTYRLFRQFILILFIFTMSERIFGRMILINRIDAINEKIRTIRQKIDDFKDIKDIKEIIAQLHKEIDELNNMVDKYYKNYPY